MGKLTGHANDCSCSICSGVRFVLGDEFAEDKTIQCVPVEDYKQLNQRLATVKAELARYKDGVRCPNCDNLTLKLGIAESERDRLKAENVRLRSVIKKTSIAVYRHAGWIAKKEFKAAAKQALEVRDGKD